MIRALLMLLVLFSIACDSDSTPTDPTPDPFPLPAGAPADAAAPAGTTRVTITAVEITGFGGGRVAPDALRSDAAGGYEVRVWIFCPAGLEGPVGEGATREILDFVITKRDVFTNIGGTFSGMVRLDPGYNTIHGTLSMSRPGRQSVRIEIRRNFTVIATTEFVAIFN